MVKKRNRPTKCPACGSTRLKDAIGGGFVCKKCGFVNKPLDKEKYQNEKNN